MPKNIIICCDGTGNQFNETYSNVVKIFMIAEKSKDQYAYYDPGVGTMSDPNVVNPLSKTISKLFGLAFGSGLKANVSEAYAYLMDYYEPGDKIYLFGFSRGAYTIRVLAAFVYVTGLLQKGSQQLIPYAWEVYRKAFKDKVKKVAAQFKETYSRDVKIHFVGAWDTVTSIGIFNFIKYPFTTFNPGVEIFRHAIAIDERRAYYRQNLLLPAKGQDVKQVWFAGAHCDVGGSYPLLESGLSQIALAWMIREAKGLDGKGFRVDPVKEDGILNDKTGVHCGPSCEQAIHKSLTLPWWILEILPRVRKRWFWVFVPLSRRRRLHTDMFRKPITPMIHQSVIDKINLRKGYKPKNVDVNKCEIEV